MGHACQKGELKLSTKVFKNLKNTLFEKKWVISVREPVKRPEYVLDYLARYTHRVAIANTRIKALKDGMVSFTAKDRKQNRTELITISAVEFIRRFLLHSLPKGFVRIRQYGFLANRNRSENLNTIRCLLAIPVPVKTDIQPVDEMMLQLTGIDITTCPCCKKGKMHVFAQIPKARDRAPSSLLCAVG